MVPRRELYKFKHVIDNEKLPINRVPDHTPKYDLNHNRCSGSSPSSSAFLTSIRHLATSKFATCCPYRSTPFRLYSFWDG